MQLTFDPLNETEAAAVAMFIATRYRIVSDKPATPSHVSNVVNVQAPTTTFSDLGVQAEPLVPVAQSAAPLPPDAPLPAAADLFGTAPGAPSAGEASATPVPPPPVPTVPAPDAPTASAGPTLPAGTVDKDGLPHDPRIHSGTKVTNADGTWRKRRGVSDETVAQVEAELRALMAIPAPGAAPVGAVPPPPVPAVPPAPVPANSSSTTDAAPDSAPTATAAAGPTEGNVPPPPVPAPPTSAPATAPIPTPPAPPAPTAAADGAPPTFAGLMRKVSGHLTTKTLTPEQIDAAMGSVQMTRAQMNLLAARPDLVEAVDAYINSLVMGAAS